ncbi:unnamed protein product [Penicillium bialowiezense]
MSLVLTVFFVNVAIYLVNTIGASTIDSLLWLLYLRLPTSSSRTARKQQQLKRAVLEQKREMNNTSSQDEFAKWAKARRRHDKTLEEYETLNKELTGQKSSFDWAAKILRWISTNGLKMFIQFWYSKSPVFPLPIGWFPYYAEWIVSFPRAPLGSVSVQVWSNVCAAAIALAAEVVGAVLVRVLETKKPVKVEAKTQ